MISNQVESLKFLRNPFFHIQRQTQSSKKVFSFVSLTQLYSHSQMDFMLLCIRSRSQFSPVNGLNQKLVQKRQLRVSLMFLLHDLFFFFITVPSLKLTLSLISIYKHDAIDIADPSSMQDACHMNFVIDFAHCRVSVAQWQSIGTQNLIPHRDSKFFLCPTLVTR